MLKLNPKVIFHQNNIKLFFKIENNIRYFSKSSHNLRSTFDTSIFDVINDIKGTRALTKEWEKLVTKAEKSVGYPTSFLNLRYLVSDEIANVASLLRKLMKTNHPLIKTARRLINEPDKCTQINGLVILLVSKTVGIPKDAFPSVDISDGIHQSQRHLAEISEMIKMASVIHKGIINIDYLETGEKKNMDYGNKIAILCGDYLLANACTHLSKLNNTMVVELMSQVIADISQSMFIKHDLEQNKANSHVKNWYNELYGSSSSLLANSCKSSVLLVNHSKEIQDISWNFAYNFDIAHKIWIELYEFNKSNDIHQPGSLMNAIFNDFKTPDNSNAISSEKIFNEASNLFNKHFEESFKCLNTLRTNKSENDAINSLASILNLMKANLD